jgi:hypothetical protein
MIKFFSILLAVAVMTTMSFAQDYPHSVGPAPQSDYTVTTQPSPNAVGTRAFTQLSLTPSFQIGKLFMESCVPTNIGAPFVITFPGGLIYKMEVFTLNQSAPFQV